MKQNPERNDYGASRPVMSLRGWLGLIERAPWPSFAPVCGSQFWGRKGRLAAIRGAVRQGGLVRVDSLPKLGKSSLVSEALRLELADSIHHAVRVDLRTCWTKESLQQSLGAGIAHLGSERGLSIEGVGLSEALLALEAELSARSARAALWVEDLPLLAGAQSRNRRREDWSWIPVVAQQMQGLSVILTTAPGTARRHWHAQLGDWPAQAPVIEIGTMAWEDLDPLQACWEERWGEGLSFGLRRQIWDCTGGHPFYLVALLKTLFQQRRPPDEEEAVLSQWAQVAEQYRFLIDHQLAGLQGNQLQLLYALARKPEDKLFSKAFQVRSGLSKELVQRAASSDRLAEWLSRDAAGRWTVVDPLLRVLVSSQHD